MYYVYILRGEKYYVGYSGDLEKRLMKHKLGGCRTTRVNQINKLIGYFEIEEKREAIILEKKIKSSGHIERWINHEKFINADVT